MEQFILSHTWYRKHNMHKDFAKKTTDTDFFALTCLPRVHRFISGATF